MTVIVRTPTIAPGTVQPKTFSDNFNRANESSLGRNWIQSPWTLPGAGSPSSFQGIIDTNQAVIRGAGPDNPTQVTKMVFYPAPIARTIYLLLKTFIQVTFISATANISGGLGLRFNAELTLGTGTNIADMYTLSHGGDLTRRTGSGDAALGSMSGGLFIANDVIRFECDGTDPANIVLNCFRNGINELSFIDNAANRIPFGIPCLQGNALAGLGLPTQNLTWDNFSCGIF